MKWSLLSYWNFQYCAMAHWCFLLTTIMTYRAGCRKKMKNKLAISIVVYKKYGEALDTVKSIEEHTSPELMKTLYLIDNSGFPVSDKERAKFENLVSVYEDVVYINTGKNLGFGKGHNYTLDRLTEEYFAIVNPDILITDGAFERLISMMDSNKTIGMTIPKLIDKEGNIQDAYRRTPTIFDLFIRMFIKNGFKKRKAYHSMKDMDYTKAFDVPFGQGSFLLIRTQLWKELGGFDDRFFMYMEDADLCRRVNKLSRVVYCPNAEVIHRWERGSHKSMKLFRYHVESMCKYFCKWGFKG